MSLLQDPFIVQILNLLSLRAFRPDPYDMTAPIKARFARKRILGIVIYPNAVKVARIHLAGTTHVELVGAINREGPSDNELLRILSNIAKENPGVYAVVAYNYGFNALKSFSIKRSETLWMALKDNPQRVMGEDFEAGHSYSVVHHPTRESAIVFSYEHAVINSIERLLEQAGILCIRLQHSIGSLFTHMMDIYRGNIPCNMLMISGSSVLYLEVDAAADHDWSLLRNRSENPATGAVEIKRQRNLIEQILPREGDLVLCVDQLQDEHLGWEDRLRELRPNLNLKLPTGKGENAKNRVFHALVKD